MLQNGGQPLYAANNGFIPYGIRDGFIVVRDRYNSGVAALLVETTVPGRTKILWTTVLGAFSTADSGPNGGGWYCSQTGFTNRTTIDGGLYINAEETYPLPPPGAPAPGQSPSPYVRTIGRIDALVQASPYMLPASQVSGWLWRINTGYGTDFAPPMIGINPQIIQLPDINLIPLGPNNEPSATIVFQKFRKPTHGGGVKLIPFSGQTICEDAFFQFHGPGDSIELAVDREKLDWILTGQHLGHARWETIKYTHTIQAPYSVAFPWGTDKNKWSELRGAMAQFFTDLAGGDIGWVLPPLSDAGANYLTSGCVGINRGTVHNVVITSYAPGDILRLRNGNIVTSITVPPGGVVEVTADGAQNWVDLY